jgi:hypothetical protein
MTNARSAVDDGRATGTDLTVAKQRKIDADAAAAHAHVPDEAGRRGPSGAASVVDPAQGLAHRIGG